MDDIPSTCRARAPTSAAAREHRALEGGVAQGHRRRRGLLVDAEREPPAAGGDLQPVAVGLGVEQGHRPALRLALDAGEELRLHAAQPRRGSRGQQVEHRVRREPRGWRRRGTSAGAGSSRRRSEIRSRRAVSPRHAAPGRRSAGERAGAVHAASRLLPGGSARAPAAGARRRPRASRAPDPPPGGLDPRRRGLRSVGQGAHQRGGVRDVRLGPDRAGRIGARGCSRVIEPVAHHEAGLVVQEVGDPAVAGGDHRLAQIHGLDQRQAEPLGAMEGDVGVAGGGQAVQRSRLQGAGQQGDGQPRARRRSSST